MTKEELRRFEHLSEQLCVGELSETEMSELQYLFSIWNNQVENQLSFKGFPNQSF